MRTLKLIAGQMNIPYIVCKAGYAEGATKPKRAKKQKETATFTNTPVLYIKLRRAA